MSWSASFPNPVPVNDPGQIHDQEPVCSPPRPEWDTELDAVFNAAVDAAEMLIRRGALGGTGKTVHVRLSGHVNPGHEPTEGWANDCVTIQLGQA